MAIVLEFQGEAGAFEVTGDRHTLIYRPRRITIDDGTWHAHESQGGTLASVWATDLGDCFVELIHLGPGPEGGELALVIPREDTVLLGDLYRASPAGATAAWASTVDLAIGLTTPTSRILTSEGEISRDELEAFHQRLLGEIYA